MLLIEYDNDDIRNLVNHKFSGIYKKMRSNAPFVRDLDKVMAHFRAANTVDDLKLIRSLNYEQLIGSDRHSVRVGYSSKYRLEFYVAMNKITLTLIEVSNHYGEH